VINRSAGGSEGFAKLANPHALVARAIRLTTTCSRRGLEDPLF
jgi:hypothetical protein